MKKAKISGEIIISALFALSGIAIMVISANYGIWDRITPFKGFMPFLAGLLMTLSSAVWFLRSVRCEKQRTDEQPTRTFNKSEVFWILIVPGIGLIIYSLLNILGMHVTLAVFFLLWLKFISKYSWKKSLVYTIVINVLFYLIFTTGLEVPFPRGYFL